MDKLHIGLAIALAFAIGCATAPLVVPPASAAAPQRWEYMCYPSAAPGAVQQKLDSLGKEGWDLITFGGIQNDFYCLKRGLH
jgi:hypothetical protein